MNRFTPAVCAALLVATPLGAQVAWDAPALVSPAAPSGLAVFLTSTSGGGLGVMTAWRQPGARVGLGYRLGLANDAADDLAVSGGIDVSGMLADGVEDADVQVQWWSGAGASVGDELVVSIPAGLTVGWVGGGDGTTFAPYAGGHVVLDLATGEGDAARLEAVADLGIDLTLTSGWIVRFGASVGGRDALAIGIRVPS